MGFSARYLSSLAGVALMSLSSLKAPPAEKANNPNESALIIPKGAQAIYLPVKCELKKDETLTAIKSRIPDADKIEEYLKEANVIHDQKLKDNFVFTSRNYLDFHSLSVRNESPFIVVHPQESKESVVKRLAKRCPPGTQLAKVSLSKVIHRGDVIVAQQLKFDPKTLELAGVNYNAKNNIRLMISEEGNLSLPLYSLITSESFKKLSPKNQIAISEILINLYDSKVPDKLDGICNSLNKIITNEPHILDSLSVRNTSVIQILSQITLSEEALSYVSENKLSTISKFEFLGRMLKALDKSEAGIFQGNKGTCAVSSMIWGLVDKRPGDFADFSYSFLSNGYYQVPINSNGLEFRMSARGKDHLFKQDNKDSRDKFNAPIGNIAMQFAEPGSTYNSAKDRRESPDGKGIGSGLNLNQVRDLLERILREDYAVYQIDNSKISLNDIGELCKKGPVIASLKWSHNSPEQIKKSLKETGGDRATAFDKDGYSYHALSILGVDEKDKKIIFRTTWSAQGHHQSEPIVKYVEGSVITMDFDKFKERVRAVMGVKTEIPSLQEIYKTESDLKKEQQIIDDQETLRKVGFALGAGLVCYSLFGLVGAGLESRRKQTSS